MNMLVMMYVFYDANGDIKAIAPSLSDFNDSSCSVANLPLAEVEPLLYGKKNPFDYTIKKIKNFAGEKFSLVRKVVEIDYVRTLDNYLTEIGPPVKYETIISVVNQISNKTVLIEIAPEFRDMYTYGSADQQNGINEFLQMGKTSIHLTEKHNPYHLYFSMTFTPQELFKQGKLYFNYEGNCNNASAYTRKIISGYGYKERL